MREKEASPQLFGTLRPLALIALALVLSLAVPAGAGQGRHIVLLPTINFTDFQVWESKYYPVDVLGERMAQHLAKLLRRDPLTDVTLLDEGAAEVWFANPYRQGDFAIQVELYSVLSKEREVLGTFEKGDISLRIRVYDGSDGSLYTSQRATGKDQRYTFDPGDDRLFFWTARDLPLFDLLHKDGLDLFRLTPADRGERMSRLTWKQFASTSTWQAVMNALGDGAARISTWENREFLVIGRITAPTAASTAKRREYIVTLGQSDALSVGDVLQVVRSDSYVTVDPENPLSVLPRVIGNVKVIKILQSQSVVVVVNERKKERIELNDLVMAPLYGPKKVAPIK